MLETWLSLPANAIIPIAKEKLCRHKAFRSVSLVPDGAFGQATLPHVMTIRQRTEHCSTKAAHESDTETARNGPEPLA